MKMVPVSLFAALFAAPAVQAADTDARFQWSLEFGSSRMETSYGLSLGYRTGEHFAPLSKLVEFKVSGSGALASVAGLPLFANSYQANQSASDQAYDAGVDTRPWYSKQWVYWTLGGVAATAAILGNNNSTSEQHTAQIQDNGSATPVSVNGDMEGGYTACADGTSVCTSIPGQGG